MCLSKTSELPVNDVIFEAKKVAAEKDKEGSLI